jgi:hypothetical protein
MKGNFINTMRYLMLALLLAPIALVKGTGYLAGGDCCPTPCGWAPFECGAINFEIKAGVAPKLWTDRDRIFAVSPAVPAPRGPFVDLVRIPRFNCINKLPWTVGFRLGWVGSCNTEVFFEFAYTQADSRNFAFGVPLTGTVSSTVTARNLSKLKEFAGYLGTRYYCDRWFCNTTSWFVGSKIGVSHHRARCFFFTSEIPNTPLFSSENAVLFDRYTSVSGGVHTGFDVRLWCGFSFVFTAEVVATCGPKGNQNFVQTTPTPGLGTTNLSVGSVGTEVTFPVTFGLAYSF